MLATVIAVGVQTWGTDVAALQDYCRAADELGYARVTYGDGLWGFTHARGVCRARAAAARDAPAAVAGAVKGVA